MVPAKFLVLILFRALQTPVIQLRLVTAKNLQLWLYVQYLLILFTLKQYENWKDIKIEHGKKQCEALDKSRNYSIITIMHFS